MPTTIPVLRGKFGSTIYYITTMKASELADKLKIPRDLPGWEDMTIEERFQREINFNRVKKQIAPYLVSDPDRFFGALIVDIYNEEGIEFEPLNEVPGNLPGLYKAPSRAFGFLHMTGGEVLVPLDGQHRLVALRFAITGKDEKGKEIPDFTPDINIGNDEVTVILVPHDPKKARKIFNKVNRYAKSTTKAENLITADDDIVAVLAREVANEELNERLVNYSSNTLNKTAHQFSTLSTVYEINKLILETRFNLKIDTTVLPDKAKQNLYRKEVIDTWRQLVDKIELFRLALSDVDESGDDKRREIRNGHVIGKPIGQYSLVSAIMRLRETESPDGNRFSMQEIFDRLNKIDWSVGNSLWQRVLMNGDRVMAGKQAANYAARFIAYYAGEYLESAQLKALTENYVAQFPPEEQVGISLPSPMFGKSSE